LPNWSSPVGSGVRLSRAVECCGIGGSAGISGEV
jgi:hypothetical protein